MFDRVQRPDQNSFVRQQQKEKDSQQKKQKAGVNPDFFNYTPNLGNPDFNITQKKEAESNSSETTSNNNQSSKSGLPNNVNSKMKNAFGTSFNDINIHTNDKSAKELGALAYTQGKDVHFAPGQYNPESKKGQELIGHELTHVVQQKEGRVTSPNIGDLKPTPPKKTEKQLKREELDRDYRASVSGDPIANIQFKLKYGKADLEQQFAQKHYKNYVKGELKQLKRNKNATHAFRAKTKAFEQQLSRDKVSFGSTEYIQRAKDFFPDFDPVSPLLKTDPNFQVNEDTALENEADVMGKKAAEGETQKKAQNKNKQSDHAQGTLQQNGDNKIYITAVYSKKGTPYSDKDFDTLFSIAKRFGITVDNLINANPGIKPNKLLQGQRIVLPKNINSENTNLSSEIFSDNQPSVLSDRLASMQMQFEQKLNLISSDSELSEEEKQNYIANLLRKIEESMMGSGDPTQKWIMGSGDDWKTRPADLFEQWILDNNWDMEELNRIIGILSNPAHGYTNRNTVTKKPNYNNYVELPEFQKDTTPKNDDTNSLINSMELLDSQKPNSNDVSKVNAINIPDTKKNSFISENIIEEPVKLSYEEERNKALEKYGLENLYYSYLNSGEIVYIIYPISGSITPLTLPENYSKYNDILSYAEKK